MTFNEEPPSTFWSATFGFIDSRASFPSATTLDRPRSRMDELYTIENLRHLPIIDLSKLLVNECSAQEIALEAYQAFTRGNQCLGSLVLMLHDHYNRKVLKRKIETIVPDSSPMNKNSRQRISNAQQNHATQLTENQQSITANSSDIPIVKEAKVACQDEDGCDEIAMQVCNNGDMLSLPCTGPIGGETYREPVVDVSIGAVAKPRQSTWSSFPSCGPRQKHEIYTIETLRNLSTKDLSKLLIHECSAQETVDTHKKFARGNQCLGEIVLMLHDHYKRKVLKRKIETIVPDSSPMNKNTRHRLSFAQQNHNGESPMQPTENQQSRGGSDVEAPKTSTHDYYCYKITTNITEEAKLAGEIDFQERPPLCRTKKREEREEK